MTSGRRPQQTVTLADVAARAGVSVSLVSRVLAGIAQASPATGDRVRAAAAELGYRRGVQPRGRPRRSPRLLDLVLGQFDTPWTDEVVAGTRSAAARHGLDLVLTAEREDPGDDWPVRIRDRGSAGVVLGLIRPTSSQLAILSTAEVPVVLLDPRADPIRRISSVGCTDWQGGYDAGQHLVRSGVASFAVVVGRPRYRFGRARAEGFIAAIADNAAGAPVRELEGRWPPGEAPRLALDELQRLKRPIGVFAMTDEMARGVYRAARQLGLVIPADVRVVGFDDLPMSRSMVPPLTTVRQPIRAMAAQAVELVRAAALDEPARRIELATELIVRAST